MNEEKIVYPSIVFKLKGSHYAIDSKHVFMITKMPGYENIPESSPEVLGIFTMLDRVIPLLDLRILFGVASLEQEYTEFTDMLEHRKQDHINWVNELERSIASGERFKLATDPHQCAFGRWYYSYEPENTAIEYHLKKMEEPHRLLHHAALEVQKCSQDCDNCKREECLKSILERVLAEYMPKVLHLLDEAKEIFRSVYQEMVIILESDGRSIGLVVDEVLAVEILDEMSQEHHDSHFKGNGYVTEIKKSPKMEKLVLMLQDTRFLDYSQNLNL